ncbi:MAG TPA: SDR family oxidoreductase [Firmicutes bacterium]|jgi:short-subunit dehydrogenase|nr:SDR family oxidoreductase [Bacillota bacterium]
MKVTGKPLAGKVVLITGGSGGLGERVAYRAAEKGAQVIVGARRLDKLVHVRDRCAELSGKEAHAVAVDMADPVQIKAAVAEALARFGTIDVLVNNAGFGYFAEAVDLDMDVAERMFRVNVLGLMHITKLVAQTMKERGRGHIINIASQGGKTATPKSTCYSGTKAAVIAYSNALRLELKPHGVYVTTVNPGPINTDFFSAADQSGDYLKRVGFILLDAERVADRIVQAMERPRREINLPRVMELGARLYALCPHLGDFLVENMFNLK